MILSQANRVLQVLSSTVLQSNNNILETRSRMLLAPLRYVEEDSRPIRKRFMISFVGWLSTPSLSLDFPEWLRRKQQVRLVQVCVGRTIPVLYRTRYSFIHRWLNYSVHV